MNIYYAYVLYYLAGPENGSTLSIADASSRNLEAPSTLYSAAGMSCLRIASSLLLIVSFPTYEHGKWIISYFIQEKILYHNIYFIPITVISYCLLYTSRCV